ncbi:MAG: type II toxin-antitoxin system VapC family toxin [Gemmatimonadetes bacterium]|nr:type II toxin-antitoxin system VapC family toxin [Gemmatimonadota bacterium]MCK5449116.1 type II toxin-antitoxin system VapC family toxin [Gemmatimonadota bacterium]
MTDEVLDSFALLAYLGDEPGAAIVERVLASAGRETSRAWMTIVNVGEVLYVTERHRGPNAARDVIALMDSLAIRVIDAGRELTFDAAHIKANHALSYADAFAAALARRLGATLITGDPEFRRVESLVRVKWLTA